MNNRNPIRPVPYLAGEKALASLIVVCTLTWVVWFVSGCSALSSAIQTVTPAPAYTVDGGTCIVTDDGGRIVCDTESFRAILIQCHEVP